MHGVTMKFIQRCRTLKFIQRVIEDTSRSWRLDTNVWRGRDSELIQNSVYRKTF